MNDEYHNLTPQAQAEHEAERSLGSANSLMSAELAEKIITAIEGEFRDWLMHGEHPRAVQVATEILERELDGWTVKAEDYDRLREAAIWLRRSCKDRLPPGHYAKLDEECRAIDAIFNPNPIYANQPDPRHPRQPEAGDQNPRHLARSRHRPRPR